MPQIARELHLDGRTVARWLAAEKFQPRQATPRPIKLDPYKKQIVRWLDSYPYSATEIFLRLREGGYTGRITIVKDYVRQIRPPRTPAFLTPARPAWDGEVPTNWAGPFSPRRRSGRLGPRPSR